MNDPRPAGKRYLPAHMFLDGEENPRLTEPWPVPVGFSVQDDVPEGYENGYKSVMKPTRPERREADG